MTKSDSSDPQPTLVDLEQQLEEISHSKRGIEILQAFTAAFRKTAALQDVLTAEALLATPVMHDYCCDVGVCRIEEPFVVLQGDIVQTESAYMLGDRIVGPNAIYAVGGSTCDLVTGRREVTFLYPIQPVLKPTTAEERSKIGGLLSAVIKFDSTQFMYLPRFSWQDPNTVAGNLVNLAKPHQIDPAKLEVARRFYSLTLVGWRIFSTLLRFITSREADNEMAIRTLPKDMADEKVN